MDLSYVAAYKLGIIGPGSGEVTVQRILPDEVRRMVAERESGRSGNATASTTAPTTASTTTSATGAVAGATEPVPVPASESAAPRALPVAPVSTAAVGATAVNGLPETRAVAANETVYLQLGAFSQPANAQSLAARVNGQLASMGVPPATVEQAGQFYRVRVGPYADRNAAMSAVQTVADKTGILPSIATQ
jgi:rare lipoprotein A